ncbi:hypothetical protein QM996_02585 [Sinorhizobium chiapasense]
MLDLLELLKRLQGGQTPPAGVIGTAQAEEQPQQEPAQKSGFNPLAHFLPEDPDKKDAVTMALLNAGAGMMAAGGPSATPTNFLSVLGQGVGAGAQGYAQARKDASDIATNGASVRNAQIKLQQAQANKDAIAQIGFDPNGEAPMSISQLKQLYKVYLDNGEFSAANSLMERIQRLDDEQRKKGAIQGTDGSYELAGGVADTATELKRAEDAGEYTTDRKNYEFGLIDPEFRKQQLEDKKASATTINNGGGSDKQFFDTMAEEAKIAKQAANGLTSMREARKAIDGGAILGAGADMRLGLQKVGALLGVTDSQAITNTETFRSAIAPQVSAMLKMTVGTANISNSDREFAEKAAGGSILLDEKSITRLLDIMERANTEIVNGFNSKVETIYPDGKGFERERALFKVAVPDYQASETTGSVEKSEGPSLLGATPDKMQPEALPTVNSSEEYNALPSGAVFYRNGQKYRKP